MDRIRMGIIGSGGISRGHGKKFVASADSELVALAEPSDASVDAFKKGVWPDGAPGDLKVYKDHKALLESEKLDGALIASPHTVHAEQVLDCLDAGLHVLCEKPLVCSFDDCLKVIEKSKATGKHVVVAYQRRFNAMYKYMKKMIHSPEFGKVFTVTSFLSQGWLELCTGKWRQEMALSGGGQLNDSGSHIVDMVMWMLEKDVDTVTALIDNRDREVDIDSMVSYRTTDGALGSLSIIGSGPTRAFWEDMTVTSDNGHSLFLRKGKLHQTDGHGTEMVEKTEFEAEPNHPSTHFIDVVMGRAKNESPPEEFLRVIAFTQACWDSAAQGGAPAKVRKA